MLSTIDFLSQDAESDVHSFFKTSNSCKPVDANHLESTVIIATSKKDNDYSSKSDGGINVNLLNDSLNDLNLSNSHSHESTTINEH